MLQETGTNWGSAHPRKRHESDDAAPEVAGEVTNQPDLVVGATAVMFHLVYISSAVVPFSPEELLDLLAKSRENNARSGLTGMLLYKDGNFMQALEGEEKAVRVVHARIESDRRHRGLITLLQGPIAERQFPDWSMGFRVPRSAEMISAPGFSQFLNNTIPTPATFAESSLTDKLLLTFKKAM